MRVQEDSRKFKDKEFLEMPSRFKLGTTGTTRQYLYVSKRCTDHGPCRDRNEQRVPKVQKKKACESIRSETGAVGVIRKGT